MSAFEEIDLRIESVQTPEGLWALRHDIAAHWHEHGNIDHFGELLQEAFGRVFACESCKGKGDWKAHSGIGSPADSDIETCRECGGSGMRDEV